MGASGFASRTRRFSFIIAGLISAIRVPPLRTKFSRSAHSLSLNADAPQRKTVFAFFRRSGVRHEMKSKPYPVRYPALISGITPSLGLIQQGSSSAAALEAWLQ